MRRWSSSTLLFMLLAAILAGPQTARADGVVRSDFVFQLDNAVFDDPAFAISSHLQGKEHVELADMVVQEEVPVRVRGISADITYKLKSSAQTVTLGAELALVSEDVAIKLTIREVSVDSVVTRKVGKTTIRARVQGTCSGLSLEIPSGKAQLMGALKVGIDAAGLPSVTVPYFEAKWGVDAWTVGNPVCSGAEGFKEKIGAGLKKFLANAAAFQPKMKLEIDARAARLQADIRAWFLAAKPVAFDVDGLTVRLLPKSLQYISGDRFQVRGDLEFAFASTAVNEVMEARAGGAPKQLDGYALLLPEGLLTTLNEMAYKTGFYKLSKHGQTLEAFRSLMNSSYLAKSFVWPELNSYSTDADFILDFTAPSKPALSSFTDPGDGSLLQAVTGSLGVAVWAPQNDGQHQRMIDFNSPINGTYRLSFATDAAGDTQLRAVFSALTMNLGYAWDPTYLTHLLRSATIGASKIQTEIENSMKTDGFSLKVGSLALTNKIRLAPGGLSKLPGWMRVDWR